jgi:hypothetical protein
MPKWEHRNVVADFGNRPPRVRWINGEQVDEQNAPTFYQYLAQMGDEGWEMVDFADGSFWFKRPVAE